jgi:hypothetical protein
MPPAPVSEIALVVSVVSFLFFILSNYDKLSKHYVAWKYNPSIRIGIRLPNKEQRFEQREKIPYTDLAPFDEELMFVLAIGNSGDFDVELDLTVNVSGPIATAHEYYGASDKIETPFELRRTLDHPSKEYDYGTYSCRRGSYTNKEQFLLVLDPEDVNIGVLRSVTVEIDAEVHADVSEFTIPGATINFPRNIGHTRFAPVHTEYEILGPDHPDLRDG